MRDAQTSAAGALPPPLITRGPVRLPPGSDRRRCDTACPAPESASRADLSGESMVPRPNGFRHILPLSSLASGWTAGSRPLLSGSGRLPCEMARPLPGFVTRGLVPRVHGAAAPRFPSRSAAIESRLGMDRRDAPGGDEKGKTAGTSLSRFGAFRQRPGGARPTGSTARAEPDTTGTSPVATGKEAARAFASEGAAGPRAPR